MYRWADAFSCHGRIKSGGDLFGTQREGRERVMSGGGESRISGGWVHEHGEGRTAVFGEDVLVCRGRL